MSALILTYCKMSFVGVITGRWQGWGGNDHSPTKRQAHVLRLLLFSNNPKYSGATCADSSWPRASCRSWIFMQLWIHFEWTCCSEAFATFEGRRHVKTDWTGISYCLTLTKKNPLWQRFKVAFLALMKGFLFWNRPAEVPPLLKFWRANMAQLTQSKHFENCWTAREQRQG